MACRRAEQGSRLASQFPLTGMVVGEGGGGRKGLVGEGEAASSGGALYAMLKNMGLTSPKYKKPPSNFR